jgi:hypothetical protein
LPPAVGVKVARKHHVPTAFAVTRPEVASDFGGELLAIAVAVCGFPETAEPSPEAQCADEPLPVTWPGLQMKKLTVPVGVPPAAVPVTTAWSFTCVPTEIAPERFVPLESCGDVAVLVVSGATVTHSLCDASLESWYVEPEWVYSARKHQTPALFAVTPGLESTELAGGLEFAIATSVRGFPERAVPLPDGHVSLPAEPETCVGSQTKKLTVPGGAPPAAVPVTTALSKSDVPSDTGLTSAVPLESDGVVTVVVGIVRTTKHSLLAFVSTYGPPV